MSSDDSRSSNVFIRFKQHVDTTISSGLGVFLTLSRVQPSLESRQQDNFNSANSISAASMRNPSQLHSATVGTCTVDMQRSKSPSHLDCFSIISSPSYLPSSLRHLPQPVPNDLPSDLDSSIFTFEDAFEDLLVVSQGQNLPDIGTKYQQRHLLQDMFPLGEPTWFWLRRLETQGLIRVPIYSKTFRAGQPDWSALHQEIDQRAAHTWGRLAGGDKRNDQDTGDFFQELGKVAKHLERSFLSASGDRDREDFAHISQQRNEPPNFDELFSAISSKFQESPSSWDTFVKTITENSNPVSVDGNKPVVPERKDKNVVTTKEEYVDRFGYLHRIVTRKTLDQNGNEIGRETHVTLCPSDKAADHHLNNDGLEEGQGGESPESGPVGTGSNWFWK